jgi:RNase P subunit RPR2
MKSDDIRFRHPKQYTPDNSESLICPYCHKFMQNAISVDVSEDYPRLLLQECRNCGNRSIRPF